MKDKKEAIYIGWGLMVSFLIGMSFGKLFGIYGIPLSMLVGSLWGTFYFFLTHKE